MIKCNGLSFDAFYKDFSQEFFFFAYRLVENREVAKDIVMQIFMNLLEKNTRFDNVSKLKSYLYTSTRNACFNYKRDQKSKVSSLKLMTYQLPSFESISDEKTAEEILQTNMVFILKHLPTQERSVLLLYMEGFKYTAISTILKVDESTARKNKTRATRKVRELWDAYNRSPVPWHQVPKPATTLKRISEQEFNKWRSDLKEKIGKLRKALKK